MHIRMKTFNYFLLLLNIVSLCQSLMVESGDCVENYCYDMDIDKLHRQYLGTKTAYPRYTDFDLNKEYLIDGCRPIKMWMLVRHGARYPVRKEILSILDLKMLHKSFIEYYKFIPTNQKCPLCSLDEELLRNWTLPDDFNTRHANILASAGFNQMKDVAIGLKKMFPTLFVDRYSNETYYFLYSEEDRIRFSYHAFVEGLFGSLAHHHIRRDQYRDVEHFLKPYYHCNASMDFSYKTKLDGTEFSKFLNTSIVQQIIRDVSLRLGTMNLLDREHILAIWNICKYQQSWNTLAPSPWCVVFSPSNYEQLDYLDDLEYYYQKGYGHNMNLKLACSAINDLLYHLNCHDDKLKVVTYFAHSTFMTLFLNTLNVFKDGEHLRADNYERMRSRKFKSSAILPIGSNIAAVKYQCDAINAANETKILFLINQKPLIFDWCNGLMCDLNVVNKHFAHYAALNCSIDFCDENFRGFMSNGIGTMFILWFQFLCSFFIHIIVFNYN